MRPFHILCFAIAGLLPVGGTALSFVRSKAAQSHAEMQAWAEQALEDCLQRDYRRPIAWGEERPGSAFAHYVQALTLVQQISPDHQQLLDVRDGELDESTTRTLLCAFAPAIAALHAGAHCVDARPDLPWPLTSRQPPPDCDLRALWTFVRLSRVEGRAMLDAGAGRRAVEFLLDAATMAADFIRSPRHRWYGPCLLSTVAEGCTEAWLQCCDRDALDLLAQGLCRLDRLPPATGAAHDSLMYEGLWHGVRDTGPEFECRGRTSWQHLWSRRWMDGAGVLAMAEWLDRTSDWSWPQRRQELDDWERRPTTVRMDVLHNEVMCRRAMAQLRLLRASVDLHRGRDVPVLEDPLGDGPIQVEVLANAVRLLSGAGVEKTPLVRTVSRR